MQFTVTFNQDQKFVHGKIAGHINQEIIWQYVTALNTCLKNNNANLILSDFREAVIPFSVVEIFHLPDKHDVITQSMGLNVKAIKRAMLFNDSSHELVQFFENVATNRGQSVKTFSNETEALEWLLGK